MDWPLTPARKSRQRTERIQGYSPNHSKSISFCWLQFWHLAEPPLLFIVLCLRGKKCQKAKVLVWLFLKVGERFGRGSTKDRKRKQSPFVHFCPHSRPLPLHRGQGLDQRAPEPDYGQAQRQQSHQGQPM